MDTTTRIPASFRFKSSLMELLKERAKASNRSLNNYVESILLDALGESEPNKETLTAMSDAKKGKNLKTVDMSDFDSFIKSCSE